MAGNRSKYYKGSDVLFEEHDAIAKNLLELQIKLKNLGKEELFNSFIKKFDPYNPKEVGENRKAYYKLAQLLHPDKNPDDAEYSKYFSTVGTFYGYGSSATDRTFQNGIREMVQDPKISRELLPSQAPAQEQSNRQEAPTTPSPSPLPVKKPDLSAKIADIHKHHEEKKNERKEEMPVFTGILFKNLQQEYKVAAKTANFAQSVKSNKSVRAKQTDYIDEIRQALQTDRKNNTLSEKDEAQVLYAALALLEKDLKNEFRWTKWLGTQSRLESIVKKDMKALQKEFPKIADGAEQKLVEFGAKHTNLKIHEHFSDLKPKSHKNR
jgi:curved DNA-binding protein CbpA